MNTITSSSNELFLHERAVKKRKQLWKKLNESSFDEKWLITRIKPNMWSIDEIYRHMLASEIFYIHSKLGERIYPAEWGVGAQWVGDRQFGLKEGNHLTRKELLDLSLQVESASQNCLKELTEEELKAIVIAPWGEKMTFKELIHHCYEHDHNHRGQIQFLITYFQQL
ncbi:MAG: DinB family protein [Candidatus Hodarchaeales archaeon]|jgi:uncharacterized damage-inducible protein DinB